MKLKCATFATSIPANTAIRRAGARIAAIIYLRL